jgi:tetratricopeptide (TPR) repeat protein
MMQATGNGLSTRLPRRWAVVLALTLALGAIVAVLRIGAAGGRRWWARGDGRDPAHLPMLKAAWNEFAAQRYDRATDLLDRRAARVVPTPLDCMLRARIAEAQGKPAEAIACLARIPDSDPTAAQARLKTGQIELARHRARAAEVALQHSLRLEPDQIQPRRELAYLYAIQLRRAECDAQFGALADRMPMGYVLAFAWCQNYCRIWDPEGARKVLKGFVNEDQDDRWSRLALAESYELTYDFDLAERLLRPLQDDDPDARALRVRLAIDQGQADAAERLARGGPADHVRLNVLRGQLALQRSDPKRAATAFRAAIGRDPGDRDAARGLGQALQALGDPRATEFLHRAGQYDKLRRTIQDSVSTIKTDPALLTKLADLCASLNRTAEARVWFRLAIERDPLDTHAQQGLGRLGEATVVETKGNGG